MSFNACCTVHDAIAYRVLCGVVFCMYNSHKILYIDFCQKAVVLLRLKDDWDVGDVLSMYHIEPSVLYLVLQSDWGCRIDAGPVDYSGCGGWGVALTHENICSALRRCLHHFGSYWKTLQRIMLLAHRCI